MVILSRLLDPNEREVKRHLSVAEAVNALEPELKELDERLRRLEKHPEVDRTSEQRCRPVGSGPPAEGGC